MEVELVWLLHVTSNYEACERKRSVGSVASDNYWVAIWTNRGSRFDCRQKQEYFFISEGPDKLWRLLNENRGLHPPFRWPRREAHHSPLSSGEVRGAWSDTFTPPHTLMAFTFTALLLVGRSNLLGDVMLHCSRWHSCFVFGRSLVQSRCGVEVFFTEVLSFTTNPGIIPEIMVH